MQPLEWGGEGGRSRGASHFAANPSQFGTLNAKALQTGGVLRLFELFEDTRGFEFLDLD